MRRSLFVVLCLVSTIAKSETAPVVLLSIDGFSAEYIERFKPKNLLKLKNEGLSSKALIPVFPTKTFPNHLSIVTGEYPSKHGIIHNDFYRRDIDKHYRYGAGKDDPSWVKAEPIWITTEKHGITSASYFWPESEAVIDQVKPTYLFPYDNDTTNQRRLDQIVSWLQLPESERPFFINSYFSVIDSAGHDFGTTSPKLAQAIKELDELLGKFLTELEQLNIEINLVIVSDHGMYDIKEKDVVPVASLDLPVAIDQIANGQTQLFIYDGDKSLITQTSAKLNKIAQGKFKAYVNGNFPEHWHLNQVDERVPDLIVNAIPPFTFSKGKHRGEATHGFDPIYTSKMNGIFISHGPNINKGVVDAFENIHVHTFLMDLLNLPKTKRSEPAPLATFINNK